MRDCDRDFLEKCRKVDFSAESKNFEANLSALVAKADNKNEERVYMKNRTFRKPLVAAVVALAVLSVSAVAFAGPIWRQIETRIVQGEQYVEHFAIYESADGYTMGTMHIDHNASVPIVVEVEGELQVLSDRHAFADLDEAISHLDIENPLLPTYLPEGFAFYEAVFPVSPVRNPQEIGAATFLIVSYSGGENELRLMISYYPEEWGFPIWSGNMIELEIGGSPAKYGDGMLGVKINDTLYSFSGTGFTMEQLVQIAESLR